MKHETILLAWHDYMKQVLPEEYTLAKSESSTGENAVRPPKPYVTYKIISGPTNTAIKDELRKENGTFALVGQRSYVISLKCYGQDHMDALALIKDRFDDPDYYDILRNCADIAVTNKGTVSDISGKLETGYEKRATLDVSFNSSNTLETKIKSIEHVEVKGEMSNIDGSKVNTTETIINKQGV